MKIGVRLLIEVQYHFVFVPSLGVSYFTVVLVVEPWLLNQACSTFHEHPNSAKVSAFSEKGAPPNSKQPKSG